MDRNIQNEREKKERTKHKSKKWAALTTCKVQIDLAVWSGQARDMPGSESHLTQWSPCDVRRLPVWAQFSPSTVTFLATDLAWHTGLHSAHAWPLTSVTTCSALARCNFSRMFQQRRVLQIATQLGPLTHLRGRRGRGDIAPTQSRYRQ
jgi:hypothetical protein